MPARARADTAEPLAQMIAPARTALVVIDFQGDFAAPNGAMAQYGVDMSHVEETIDRTQQLIAAGRKAGVRIVFARVVTRPETDAENLKAFYRRRGFPEEAAAICRAGTAGADYYRVEPVPGDIEIEKPLFSSFVGTDLEEQLRAARVDTLVITGMTTECCVDCTTRDAFHRGYNCFLVEDACTAYEESLHRGAVEALSKNCALLVQTDEVEQAWTDAAA